MYSVFIRDWLSVFPRSQVHVVRGEDYYANREIVLNEIFLFLGLAELPSAFYDAVSSADILNSRTAGRRVPEMEEETRKLLTEFYQPYNQDLAELLHDRRFLWDS